MTRHKSAPRIQTHVEVLWRTLIADCWEGQHPAPLEAGYGFVDSLIQDIKQFFYATTGEESKDGGTDNEKEQSKKLSCLKTLATSEVKGFTKIQRSGDNPEERIYISGIDPNFASMPEEEVERILTRFLPKFDNWIDIAFRKLNDSRRSLWNVRFSQVMPGRKLFRTHLKRSLGTGPQSLEPGDIVCVLAGGTVPYLIRPINGGRENKFSFVGEAYVHGIMHGEAVRAEGATLQDIVLV
jgi:hypothetical protein